MSIINLVNVKYINPFSCAFIEHIRHICVEELDPDYSYDDMIHLVLIVAVRALLYVLNMLPASFADGKFTTVCFDWPATQPVHGLRRFQLTYQVAVLTYSLQKLQPAFLPHKTRGSTRSKLNGSI